ncbi:hypothetical protein J14TS2_39710 [Bacillus sp. J14TS2]|uniref:anti-repressor SinI family protein n=1 Tax=unclassified Bacillus (in: firmicutes) TaxID=185979 RepID=UPI001A972C8D|nr:MULTISPECIES: anti-repressor SinI family protein [unclassified Bacillus (in: firmicutes)]MBO0995316.1 anti-repressor SinI family protein [Bacillus sp. SD088]GIN73496.1 hypothetical protein J14TS2_39710 [Bacillus sp. J14TS2]
MDKITNQALDHEWKDLILKALEAGMTSEAIRDFFRQYITTQKTQAPVERKAQFKNLN